MGAFVYLLVMCSMVSAATGAKILLLPFSYSSHVSELANIGRSLLNRGHDVHMLVSPSLPDIERFKKKISVITHHIVEPDIFSMPQEDLDEMWEALTHITLVEDLRTSLKGFVEMCTNPLSDEQLIEKLHTMKFDFAIVDTIVCSRCLTLIPYRLGIPFVNVVTAYEPWLLRNPALPSFVPFNMYGAKSSQMTFWERLDNTYRQVEWTLFPQIPHMADEYLSRYLGNKPPVPINQLAGQALLWLIDTDFAIDYPRPVMPNEILIGGLTTQKGKPLPDDLERFTKQYKDGVIVVSFGSMATNLPEDARLKLIQALGKVKYGVIWRYPHSPPEKVPANLKLLSWIPQQDLLSHPATKLFFTHCGANSQFESLYHAVPMLGMPLFAEQHYNAKRAEYRGLGKTVNINDFTADELLSSINEVITNGSYQDNIDKASRIFRSAQMTPGDRATWWIEHVIQHGGQHLRAYALDMPWYQYLMFDILIFVSVIIALILFIVVKVLSACIKIVGNRNGGPSDNSNVRSKKTTKSD